MKKIFAVLGLVGGFFAVYAQNGEIAGKVIDEGGEGIPHANVQIVDNGGVVAGRGTTTDFDGNYSIKPLTPGKYNLQWSYVGYVAQLQQGVVVNADKATYVDVKLKTNLVKDQYVEIITPKTRLEGTNDVPGPHKFILSLEEKGRNFYLVKVRTEEEVSNWSWIEVDYKVENAEITISLSNVLSSGGNPHAITITKPKSRLPDYAKGEKSIGPLPRGKYRTYATYNGDTANGTIKIKDATGTFTLKKNSFASSGGNRKFVKTPGNTLWGFILYWSKQDSVITTDYLKLLGEQGGRRKKLAPGNYYAFKVDSNKKTTIYSKGHGWNYEDEFVFDYKQSFEELKELTRKFIHEKGDDNVDIILYNDKGEWFSEVR